MNQQTFLPARTFNTTLFTFISFCLTVLLLTFMHPAMAQNTLNLAGLNSSAPASTAYSMRLLSSTYTGSALQIRRSNDNATQDIGFTINGDLDTVALKTFVGGNNGYVSIWYDQSGNANNLVQPTQQLQPTLITGGVIERENSQPFLRFFVSFSGPASLYLTGGEMTRVGHVSAIHRFQSNGDGFILSHTGDYYWHSDPAQSLLFYDGLTSLSIWNGSAWVNGNATAPNVMQFSTTLTLNEIEPLDPNSQTSWDNIGADRVYHFITGGGGYSELLVFPDALSVTNRQSAEIGQLTYFFLGGTLPLTWISFNVVAQGTDVQLKWETADEQQTKDFTIQHSTNGSRWTNIETIAALHSNQSINQYTYLHKQAGDGNHYYRLLQADLDGKKSYSIVKTIRLGKTAPAFAILGNPTVNGLLFVQTKQSLVLSLYTAEGKLIWKKQITAGTHQLNVRDLPKSIYFLKANNTTERVLIQ